MIAFAKGCEPPVIKDIDPATASGGMDFADIPSLLISAHRRGWWAFAVSREDDPAMEVLHRIHHKHFRGEIGMDMQMCLFPFAPTPICFVMMRKSILSADNLRFELKSLGVVPPIGDLELGPFFVFASRENWYTTIIAWIRELFISARMEAQLPDAYK